MNNSLRFFLCSFLLSGLATTAIAGQRNEDCKACHPLIYSEFHNSAHRKSSIFEDDIHQAVWNVHPLSKQEKYRCADCHTPTDTKLQEALKEGEQAVPEKSDVQTEEAISCSYCHSIEKIEEHADSYNRNILSKKSGTFFSADESRRDKKITFHEKKSFFGLVTKSTGSPFHNIDFTNPNFYSGKVCMGCHAHFENKQGQNVCRAEISDDNAKSNCITCHMPKVSGSATTIKITPTHTSHDFAGARNRPDMLAGYLDMAINKADAGFTVTLKNHATHKLFLQPLRLALLKISIQRKGKTIALKPVPFFRVLGKDGKPAMPWNATGVFKDTMLNAGESRTVSFDTVLQSGDVVESDFGFFLVNPKVVKKFQLENSEQATRFNLLKKTRLVVD